MTITENTRQVGTLNWFYREAAPTRDRQASPALFLHGLPAHSYIWREILPQVAAAGYRAIAPDWIGSGFSDKPDKRTFAYTPDAYLQALGEFIEILDIKPLSLIVQGYLASIGVLYAQQNPDAIDRLIILNSPLFPADKLPWKMQQWGLPFAGDMLTQDPILVDRTLEGGSGFVISDPDLAIFRKPFLKSSAVGRALLTTTQKLNLAQISAKIEQGWQSWEKPTLLLWGEGDPWLRTEPVQALAQKQANLDYLGLEEAKHYPQEHWPQEVGEAIVTFLRRQAL